MTDDAVFDQSAPGDERRRLMRLTYRMLGTVADAEDAVQETYIRWYRLDEDERAAIANPAAWLTRVAGRVCLDLLGSARARRERYVGEWLPEPVPGGSDLHTATLTADPLERVTLDDTISTALMVALESLSPAERVAFVLHDVFLLPFGEVADIVSRTPQACRQLATSARRHVRERRARYVNPRHHDELVRAFVRACESGDLRALTAVLDPSVELRSDGGGIVSAARRPVVGAENVARFFLGVLQKQRDVAVHEELTADGATLVVTVADTTTGVLNIGVDDTTTGAMITAIWLVMNPEKLTLWNPAQAGA